MYLNETNYITLCRILINVRCSRVYGGFRLHDTVN